MDSQEKSIIAVVPADPISAPILRLLDANANRAREALRTLEDYARFVRNDQDLSREIKNLRHQLADVLAPILPAAILHRDVSGDVGTTITTTQEQSRTDLPHVVTAAAKRASEALRSIEEYLKTRNPAEAGKVESLRYRLYTVEQRIALTLRPRDRMTAVKLYVLITESFCRLPWLRAAELAIQGGADCLQLREKDLPGAQLLDRAIQLANLCRKASVPCIINDRIDIALASGADGVHLGQDDLPPLAARRILGNEKIVGVSTHNLDHARRAVADGADYIGVGPIFPSSTKPRDFIAGLEYAAQAAREIDLPAFAISGIGPENVDKVLATGISRVAVAASVTDSQDPAAAARAIKNKLIR